VSFANPDICICSLIEEASHTVTDKGFKTVHLHGILAYVLTKRQKVFFQFLCDHQNKFGYPPSYSEIARHFGFKSDGTINTYLTILSEKGYLEKNGKARSIRILKDTQTHIPILGSIAAGFPLMAEENFKGWVDKLTLFEYKKNKFALKIKGDSMKNVGILDGDIVKINHQNTVKNGQIAALLIEGEATLKRFFLKNGHICLVSENELYQDMIYPLDSVQILGIYVGLIRNTV